MSQQSIDREFEETIVLVDEPDFVSEFMPPSASGGAGGGIGGNVDLGSSFGGGHAPPRIQTAPFSITVIDRPSHSAAPMRRTNSSASGVAFKRCVSRVRDFLNSCHLLAVVPGLIVLSLVCFVFASYNGISALNGPQSGGQTLSPTGIGGFVFGGANATSSRHSGNGLEVVGSNGGLSSAPSARERAWSARTTKDLRPPSRCGTVRLVSVAILRLLLDFSRFVYQLPFLFSHLQAATAA